MFSFVKKAGWISPTQLTGVLVFLLSSWGIVKWFTKIPFSAKDMILAGLGALLLFNGLRQFPFYSDIYQLGALIKLLLPITVFFYLRAIIQSQDTLRGVLLTLLLSSVVPVSLFLFEFFVQPLEIRRVAAYRGGGLRITGPYPDLYNYLSYFIVILLVGGRYFIDLAYWRKEQGNGNMLPTLGLLAGILALSVLALIGFNHQASWGVIPALLALLAAFSWKTKEGKIYIISGVLGLLIALPFVWEHEIAPLFAKEIAAFSGNFWQDISLNGRVEMWNGFLEQWYSVPMIAKLFGVGLLGKAEYAVMLSAGTHSQYLFFLFAGGIVGLASFLIFLLLHWRDTKDYTRSWRYFSLGILITLVLYAGIMLPFSSPVALMYLILIGLGVDRKLLTSPTATK